MAQDIRSVNSVAQSLMNHYTLTKEDVGCPWLKIFSSVWLVTNFMGRVLPGDVGKRVYLRGGVLQVENDEQRDKRLLLEKA